MKSHLFYSFFFANLLVLFAQPALAQFTQITGIKYKLTDKQLQIILVTTTPKNLLGILKRQGNTQIFNIPNAQLSLPCGNIFSRDNPAKGIQSIKITPRDNNQVSIVVKSEKTLPKILVSISQAKIDCIKCSFQYPEELRKKGIEGSSEVVLDIDEQGNVTKINLGSFSGNTELDNAVLMQARNMKFINNACGQKDITLKANFMIQGSVLHYRAIEEYKVRRNQEYLRQQLRKEEE